VKVTKDKIENSQAFLTIEVEPAEVEVSLEEAYRRLVKKADVPGFRRGKAPRAILERYIGKDNLMENALNTLIPRACEDALKEQEIEAFARPDIEITQTEPLIFKATVPLPPTVKLGDYHSIRVTPEVVEVTDDNVSSVIEKLRHQQATWEPVEREVDFNDLVVFNIESTIEDKPYINQQGAQYQVLKDYPAPVPGFAEQLVGMGRGKVKEFQLPIPNDYPDSELAGKEASFRIEVREIKQENLPELNDEFAKGVDPKFETLDSLQRQVSDNLRLRAEEKSRLDFEARVIDAAADQAEVEFPPILVEMEISRLLEQQLRPWQERGQGLEEYLASINKTEAEVREELRPSATKRVTRSLVLDKIAHEEKIEVSDSEIDAEIEETVKGVAEGKRDEFKKFLNMPQSRESVKQSLIRRKTIERLVAIARGLGSTKETTEKEAVK